MDDLDQLRAEMIVAYVEAAEKTMLYQIISDSDSWDDEKWEAFVDLLVSTYDLREHTGTPIYWWP